MKRKLSQAIVLSAGLAAFTFAFAAPSSACIYSQGRGISDAVNPDTAPGSLDSTIDGSDVGVSSIAGLSGLDQLSVAGVGLMAVAVATGGILLKARLARQSESPLAEQSTMQSEMHLEAADLEPANFAIVIPPAALSSLRKKSQEESASDLTLMR